MKTYSIPEQNIEKFGKQIASLAKKAEKLGLEQPTMKLGEYKDIADNDGIVTRLYTVEITGSAPRINGWQVIGKLEHNGDDNVVKSLTDEELPEQYSNSQVCEHCGINRMRNVTYVLRNEAGEMKQVGSSCLKDFTGHASPQEFAEYSELLAEIEIEASSEYCLVGESGIHYLDTATFLAWVACETRQNGFVSKSKAGTFGCSTADAVLSELGKRPYNRNYEPSDEDRITGKSAYEWIKTYLDSKRRLNEFEHNLAVITNETSFKTMYAGYVAAILPMYQKQMEEDKISNAGKNPGSYLGQVKGKIEFTSLELISIKYIDSRFGRIALHKFQDENGNVVVWFSSSWIGEEGTTYTGKATVKEHSEYAGVKQTVITRARLLEA